MQTTLHGWVSSGKAYANCTDQWSLLNINGYSCLQERLMNSFANCMDQWTLLNLSGHSWLQERLINLISKYVFTAQVIRSRFAIDVELGTDCISTGATWLALQEVVWVLVVWRFSYDQPFCYPYSWDLTWKRKLHVTETRNRQKEGLPRLAGTYRCAVWAFYKFASLRTERIHWMERGL